MNAGVRDQRRAGSPWLRRDIPKHSMGLPLYAYIGVVLGVNVGIYGSPMGRVWDIYDRKRFTCFTVFLPAYDLLPV